MNRNNFRFFECPRPGSTAGGFTLLEMTLAIVLAVMFASLLVPLFDTVIVEKRLRSASSLYSEFAQTAFRESLREGVPYQVCWNDKTITLVKLGTGHGDKKEEDETLKTVDIPTGITVTNLYSVDKKGSRKQSQWGFYPTGVCQPMRIKLMLGGSWIDLTFSPLTATVIEETYAF